MPVPYEWLSRAAQHAQDAKERGYVVRIHLTPEGAQVTLRMERTGHVLEVIKMELFGYIFQTRGKCLLLAIERAIAEANAYVFGQDYLPAFQAKRKQSVENACYFFYDVLDSSMLTSDKDHNWHFFAEKHPDEADAIRRAMKAAMMGGRSDAQPV